MACARSFRSRCLRRADRRVRVPDRAAARPVVAVRDRRRGPAVAAGAVFLRRLHARLLPGAGGLDVVRGGDVVGAASIGTIGQVAVSASIVAVFLVASFLSWPIWLGPLLLVFLALVLRADLSQPRAPACTWRSCSSPLLAIVAAAFLGSMGMDGDRPDQRRGAASVAREPRLAAAAAGGDRRACRRMPIAARAITWCCCW